MHDLIYGSESIKHKDEKLFQMVQEFDPDADKYLNDVSTEEWKNRIEEFLQTVHKGE